MLRPEFFVSLLGMVVLLGWLFDVRSMEAMYPGLSAMKANTAVGLVVAAAGVSLLRSETAGGRRRVLGWACAAVVALIGLATLGEDAFGWRLGIDQLLFHDGHPVAGTAPGRMAVNTAVALALVGVALVALGWGAVLRVRIAEVMAVLVGAIGLFGFAGYLYGVRTLQSGFAKNFGPMKLPTALAVMLLAAAVLAARPRRGLAALVASSGPGGVLIRRLLVPAVGLLLILGWLELRGERSHVFGGDVGVALYILVASLGTAALVVAVAGSLNRADAGQVAARVAAEESERKFRTLLESVADAVVIAGADGRIVLVNRAAEQLFGYEPGTLAGEPVETLVPDALSERHRSHLERYLAEPRPRVMGSGLDLSARRADGTEIAVEISLGPAEVGGELLVIAMVRDVTEQRRAAMERRRLLEHLVRAQEEERGRIGNDIHDDSVQVMTALALRLELFRAQLDDPELLAAIDELERVARSSIARLRHLIFELRPPALDREGIAAALHLYLEQMRIDERIEYTLDNSLGSEPDPVARTILYRIAQEALLNVAKHARASRVDVVLEQTDDGVTIRVNDNGVGLSHDAYNSVQPGHLGLVAMRERAEMAGGWWKASSEGEGTRVEFFVPVTLQAAPAEAP